MNNCTDCCFFIGGYDVRNYSDWKWASGETETYYWNWLQYAPAQPDDVPGSCLYFCVDHLPDLNGKWGDFNCTFSGTTLKYLCEKSF